MSSGDDEDTSRIDAVLQRAPGMGRARFRGMPLHLAYGLRGVATKRVANSTDPVAVSEHIEVDGARLYIEVRGDHANAPLMVWLHGGPGDLERHFLVAYYDQRSAGRSFEREVPAASINIARRGPRPRHRSIEIAIPRNRVLLVGHSWGTILGMLYAKAHSEKVSGLICVAPVVSFSEQHRREHAYDLAEATRRGENLDFVAGAQM